MQVDNLRPDDLEKFKEVFKKVKEENPEARMTTFLQGKVHKKDCLFKDKCRK